ncbi:type II toxin-antitoxin system HicA family toxin [Pseudomonas fontis]|uniref:Type II toxin-antitoxin system HicA family toxin n=1 Tax=Pseudomonas fontis TaxID=2942633 RepID=A0ABT5NP45_9PSED|nr:type II toxin-antitoxin system HicA family toxin [Pseudomonas fontis]MDD0974403.1 type II toxin-antitoxin system HicA family toxin [Pseudomonas fontis]MDD0989945.1 type II toxin-antitoxin system HicA family toxin [Pseudomonas fontis]
MRSREVIRMIEAAGWYEVAVKGSHHQFKHALRIGRVTVPQPQSDLPIGTVMNIFKQTGLNRSGLAH